MKKITTLITILLIVGVSYSQENDEKRIKFNKGVIKICSLSNITISGYDGDEVIIENVNSNYKIAYNYYNQGQRNLLQKDTITSKAYRYLSINSEEDEDRLEKGLKSLGNKSDDPEDNLFFIIEENPGELIIKDYPSSDEKKISNLLFLNREYEILIPNTVKLLWNTENCSKTKINNFFTTSEPWELSNFKGEAEISSSYGSIELRDVSGPVIANTIGGNIKVIFDKETPNNLYSLISNSGYIDITLPENADIKISAIGKRILSDIDFEVLNESIVNGLKDIDLKLSSGKTKMTLDAGSGSVYLRKNN